MTEATRALVEETIRSSGGVLQMDPALVARDWLAPGRRMGLSDAEYDVGERGFICERWLASVTRADNRIGPDDEGISHIRGEGSTRINLVDAIDAAADLIMGADYAATHDSLGRLAKIYDYGGRIPYHVHPPQSEADKVGRRSKDEAYYFPPDVPMGKHPETFLGFHPFVAEHRLEELLLEPMRRWNSDDVLKVAKAYQQFPEEGFYIPSGILHGPGTAVTIELQEDSDTLAMCQALNNGGIIDKELLFKDVSEEDRETLGEAALMSWIDWDGNGDPYFYENHHINPLEFYSREGVSEAWIFYGGEKFSGKRIRLAPGASYSCSEKGVFNLLVWRGEGIIGGVEVAGGRPGRDELLVVHSRAIEPLEYVNTGDEDMYVIKFFGPDINDDSPQVSESLAATIAAAKAKQA